jgi:hypothetical protein
MNRRSVTRVELIGYIILALLIIIIIIFAAYWVFFGSWQGSENFNACNDFNPCTNNKLLPDSSCINRNLQFNTSCSPEDVCYNSSAVKVCQSGKCISDRIFCKGYCQINSDCPTIPLSPRLDGLNVTTQCLEQSCVYTIIGGLTAQCLSWVDNPPDNPLVLQGCLIYRFTDLNGTFLPGICFIRYDCAPFDFEPIILSDSNNNLTSTAISFFKTNRILFSDIPIYGKKLINLYLKFDSLITKSLNLYHHVKKQ